MDVAFAALAIWVDRIAIQQAREILASRKRFAASRRSETVESHSCETLTSHPYETQRHSRDGLSDRVADLASRLPDEAHASQRLAV